jgi:hypothetical protein
MLLLEPGVSFKSKARFRFLGRKVAIEAGQRAERFKYPRRNVHLTYYWITPDGEILQAKILTWHSFMALAANRAPRKSV